MSVARLLALAPLLPAAPQGGPSPNLPPPNFVVILADDLGYGDVGPYDHDSNPATPPVTNTPVLDAMAAQGIRLTSYYSVAPVCTPSRACLQTGRQNARTGISGVIFPNDPNGLPPSELTVAELLRAQGYATGAVGKWHLGDQAQYHPLNQGYESFFGPMYSNDMWPFYLIRDWVVVDASPDQAQLTQTFLNEARQFISGAVAQGRPFLLYMPLTAVHIPIHVSPAFYGVTGRGLYADCVYEIDDAVGRIRTHLEQFGVAGNTLVVFTSDNGPNVGGSAGPLRGLKGTVFEGGIRVPFVACWPGHIPAGLTSDVPTAAYDLLPTLADLARALPPTDRVIDGRSLAPVLFGQGPLPDRMQFFTRSWNSGHPNWGVTRVWAMRSGRWKLHFDSNQNPTDLYDLDLDLGETIPINAPAVVATLYDKAREFQVTINDLPNATPATLNLALNRPVQVSSSVGADTSGRAVDGIGSTMWRSQPGDDEWIVVDLGSAQPIAQLVLYWGPFWAKRCLVQVSDDASMWMDTAAEAEGNGGRQVIRVGSSGRYVRIQGVLSYGGAGYSLRELAVQSVGTTGGGAHSSGPGPQ